MRHSITVLSEIAFGGEWKATKQTITRLKRRMRVDIHLIAFCSPSIEPDAALETLCSSVQYIPIDDVYTAFFTRSFGMTWSRIFRAFSETYKKTGPTIYIGTHYILIWYAFFFRIFHGYSPLLFFFHGRKSSIDPPWYQSGKKEWIIVFFERFALCLADKIVVPSLFAKEYVHHILPSVFHKKSIVVVPNFISPQWYKSTVPDSRKKYGYTKRDKIILFVGALHTVKGIQSLLQGFFSYQKNHQNTRLLIVCPELKAEAAVETYIKTCMHTDRYATFVQMVISPDMQRLREIYHFSDVTVVPSLVETYSFVCLESMVSGTPVIGTPVGIMADLLPSIDPHLLLPSHKPRHITRRLKYIFSLDTYAYHQLRRVCRQKALRYTASDTFTLWKKVLVSYGLSL